MSSIAAAAILGLSSAAAQSPPPVDPAPAASLLAIATQPGEGKLTVTTPGWKDGEDIPFKYTQYQGNDFPGVEWTAGPATTKSYAIIMQDSAFVMRGAPILHWSVVNIPANVTRLPEGMKPDEKPEGSIYGPNYRGLAQPYLGPRTPPGPKHRYHIQVLALDVLLPADFAPKSYSDLMTALTDHVLASGQVTGLGQVDPSATR